MLVVRRWLIVGMISFSGTKAVFAFTKEATITSRKTRVVRRNEIFIVVLIEEITISILLEKLVLVYRASLFYPILKLNYLALT